jgi:hypothetical protein
MERFCKLGSPVKEPDRMRKNPELKRAVDRAIANGSPIFVNDPAAKSEEELRCYSVEPICSRGGNAITCDGPHGLVRNGTHFEVVQHPHSPKHLLFQVTTRNGNVFACASAWDPDNEEPNTKPIPQTVEYHWKHSRHDFLPYDSSTGSYCK